MPSRVASWHHGSSVSVILTPMRRRRSSRPCSVIFGNRAVRSAGVVEVAVRVLVAAVPGGDPRAAAPDVDLAQFARRAAGAVGPLHLHPHPGDGLAEGARLDAMVRRPRIVREDNADLGGA